MNELTIGNTRLIHGNVLEVLKSMPSDSVDLIVTSPPYYALRKYPDETEIEWEDGIRCQLGLEPTPELYVEHLSLILKELYRVIKPTGVFFLNIGDSYSGDMGKRKGWSFVKNLGNKKDGTAIYHKASYDLPRKCMLCIPERVLFKCLEIGFIVRNKIIWRKPNALPSSVKDRFSVTWEYVYMFVKKAKGYYFNLDAVREPYSNSTIERAMRFIKNQEHFDPSKHKHVDFMGQNPYEVLENVVKSVIKKYVEGYEKFVIDEIKSVITSPNVLGKNPGDVWDITTEQFRDAHFSVFPKKLVARCIACACPPNGIVLDPFMGSGTTAVVCELFNTKQFDKISKIETVVNLDVVKKIDWNIKCIGIDIVKDYIDMAYNRIKKDMYNGTKSLGVFW